MKYFYLAYGSNLNVRQMKLRCPTARVVGTAEIKDYELLFKGSQTGSYLTIELKKGGIVPVAVWEVQEQDVRLLDRYEGWPRFYYKKDMEIRYKGIRTTKKIWKSDTKESAPADTEQSPHLFTLCTKTEKLEYRATDTLAPALRVITISDSI